MVMSLKDRIHQMLSLTGHLYAKLTKKYYFEDYVRVYPNGIIYNRWGIKKTAASSDLKNFKNHCKFYLFASQFVKNKSVADIGCGSGYGCQILKESQAKLVCGADASSSTIQFAKNHFGKYANFSVQSITNMKDFNDGMFDISITSEVLEHIKEYNMENEAIKQLKRITKPQGLIIIATPNNEMLHDHGFSYEEISSLMKRNFKKYIIFENALIPFGKSKKLWKKRLSKRNVGIIISEKINLSETLLPEHAKPELKKGDKIGKLKFANYQINTSLLHNTHSWITLAINS